VPLGEEIPVEQVYISGAGNNMLETSLGQLWTQVASVHHEYGRLTLATAGLLLLAGTSLTVGTRRFAMRSVVWIEDTGA